MISLKSQFKQGPVIYLYIHILLYSYRYTGQSFRFSFPNPLLVYGYIESVVSYDPDFMTINKYTNEQINSVSNYRIRMKGRRVCYNLV